eukprot:7390902-Prymnesium_polylepis.2
MERRFKRETEAPPISPTPPADLTDDDDDSRVLLSSGSRSTARLGWRSPRLLCFAAALLGAVLLIARGMRNEVRQRPHSNGLGPRFPEPTALATQNPRPPRLCLGCLPPLSLCVCARARPAVVGCQRGQRGDVEYRGHQQQPFRVRRPHRSRTLHRRKPSGHAAQPGFAPRPRVAGTGSRTATATTMRSWRRCSSLSTTRRRATWR